MMKVYEFQITYICPEVKLLVLAESKDEAMKVDATKELVARKAAMA